MHFDQAEGEPGEAKSEMNKFRHNKINLTLNYY